MIIGTGCAGLTAAIYAARGHLSPLVLEGVQPGGQLSTTTLVENFPGFPEGIDGPELILNMKAQAQRFGARFEYAELTGFEPQPEGHIRLEIDGDRHLDTRTLIIASGARARWLDLPREKELIGHGLTSCATCDGAFFKDVPVCVVGGGDSAAEEAIFLTRFASKVYLIHRRDRLRATKIMAERVFANPKIEPVWNAQVTEYLTDAAGEVSGVRIRDTQTGDTSRTLAVKCVFMAIGHDPSTEPFVGKLPTDHDGYLQPAPGPRSSVTNIPGVFIAGDVSDRVYRQAITAAGAGCAAALDAEHYLSSLNLNDDDEKGPHPQHAVEHSPNLLKSA